MRLPPLSPRPTWQLPSPGELPTWPKHGRVCVDVETRDPQLLTLGPGVRRDGYVVGIAFAIEDGPSFYLPTRHANGVNLDPDRVHEYLRDQARDFCGEIVGHNLSYDLDYLAQEGIVFRRAKFRDTMVAASLVSELERSYALARCCEREGIPGKDESLLDQAAAAWGVHPKAGLWQLPPEFVGPYGEGDVEAPLRLLRRLERHIDDQDLWEVWNRESALLPVLVKMRRRGVRIDFDQLERVEEDATTREISALAHLSTLSGHQLDTSDTNRTASWVPILEERGFTLPRTDPSTKFPEGQPSVKNEWLRAQDDEVCRFIIEARRWNKVRTTFVESIRTHQVNGRIHATLRQMVGSKEGSDDATGAKFGRLSCSDPNMQQQPARDPDIGPMWRAIYLPDGERFLSADYSSQEPRNMVHFAEASKCEGGAEMAQRYRDDPFLDYHQVIADLMGVVRKQSKHITLGLSYGMGPGKLAKGMGLPYTEESFKNRDGEVVEYLKPGPEAEALIEQYHEAVPYVKQFSEKAIRAARRRGYVKTFGGRRCRFKQIGREWLYSHKAPNRVVQGSSGDQMRQAMIDADAAGHKLQMQVHDELNEGSNSEKEARELADIMLGAMGFNVPHVIDLEWGPNWGEMELLAKVA